MKNQNIVPQIDLGVDTTNDPANAMFTDANFPGAANADLTNARALYALLTGRVTNIGSEVRLDGATGQYVYMGAGRTSEHQDELGLFVQDSWRLRPNLTVNAGLRWQVAFPFQADTSVYSMNTFADLCGVSGPGNGPGGRACNLFNPGVFNPGGRVPVYEQYYAGSPRLQDRVQQLRAERGRRVAAERAERLAARAPRRPGPGDAAGELRRRLQQRRPRASSGTSTTPIPAARCRRRVRRRARSSRSCPPGERGRCCCASRSVSAHRPAFRPRPSTRWRSISTTASTCSIPRSGRRRRGRTRSGSSARSAG